MQTMTESPSTRPTLTSSKGGKHRALSGSIPDCLPSYLVKRCGGSVRATFRFSVPERLVLKKR